LAHDDGPHATREGLGARHAEESARLARLIEEATDIAEDRGVKSAELLTVSRSDRLALLLLVCPVRGFHVDDAHPVRAIVFVSDPAQRVRPTPATLHALYGLTPAEYRLAMLLADGKEPNAIAEMIGVSRNTLKTQLAGIYRKTGTSRQAQLVGLLLQLPTASPTTPPEPQ
jgi:DNA-binding CsgD family transcriptional regulator